MSLLITRFKMCQACLSMRSRYSYRSRIELHKQFISNSIDHGSTQVSSKTKTKRLQNQKIKQPKILPVLRFQPRHLLLKSLSRRSPHPRQQVRSISFHIFSEFKQLKLFNQERLNIQSTSLLISRV